MKSVLLNILFICGAFVVRCLALAALVAAFVYSWPFVSFVILPKLDICVYNNVGDPHPKEAVGTITNESHNSTSHNYSGHSSSSSGPSTYDISFSDDMGHCFQTTFTPFFIDFKSGHKFKILYYADDDQILKAEEERAAAQRDTSYHHDYAETVPATPVSIFLWIEKPFCLLVVGLVLWLLIIPIRGLRSAVIPESTQNVAVFGLDDLKLYLLSKLLLLLFLGSFLIGLLHLIPYLTFVFLPNHNINLHGERPKEAVGIVTNIYSYKGTKVVGIDRGSYSSPRNIVNIEFTDNEHSPLQTKCVPISKKFKIGDTIKVMYFSRHRRGEFLNKLQSEDSNSRNPYGNSLATPVSKALFFERPIIYAVLCLMFLAAFIVVLVKMARIKKYGKPPKDQPSLPRSTRERRQL